MSMEAAIHDSDVTFDSFRSLNIWMKLFLLQFQQVR